MLRLEPFVPHAPDWRVGWAALWPVCPHFAPLDACPQDPLHHGEGDVGIHTRMVVEALVGLPEWRALPPEDRALLFWAACLHDIGKPATTKQEDGRITSRGHSRVGALMAREWLREVGAPFAWREALCGLIAHHQLPFWLNERPSPQRLAISTAQDCRADWLCLHARADALGRICQDQQAVLDNVALAREVFSEAGCLSGPYPFANAESRLAFWERPERAADYPAFEDFRCTAYVMSGLPGAGKDTWIRQNLPQLPMVSLDAIRAQNGVSPRGNQGRVIQAANEQARVHLRARQDFVWNGTNVTRQNRARLTKLLRDYKARIHMVYIEVPPNVGRQQNKGRGRVVPEAVIAGLERKLEPPTLSEAHEVTLVVG
ncbi:MAG: AAA family ATPase [Rhodobacteraceae bacterium]|nr:AAA family ATPase [Paracoccaceae bacterium]